MKKITILAALFTLVMICGGCSGTASFHYTTGGKWNPVDTHQAAKTVYKGNYRPPFPMSEPQR